MPSRSLSSPCGSFCMDFFSLYTYFPIARPPTLTSKGPRDASGLDFSALLSPLPSLFLSSEPTQPSHPSPHNSQSMSPKNIESPKNLRLRRRSKLPAHDSFDGKTKLTSPSPFRLLQSLPVPTTTTFLPTLNRISVAHGRLFSPFRVYSFSFERSRNDRSFSTEKSTRREPTSTFCDSYDFNSRRTGRESYSESLSDWRRRRGEAETEE